MRGRFPCCLGWLALLAGAPAGAITLGSIDTFQAGTLQSWSGGSPLANVATGGPGGTGDRYLQISATNDNFGAFNAAQWAGDYLGAGVTSLRLDLQNQGNVPIHLRITVFGPGAATAFTSLNAFVVQPGSGWVSAEFALTDDALVRTRGTDTVTLAQTLASVSRLLIRHDPDPLSQPGEANPVTASLGIDNITAVPEPASALLVGAGLAVLGASRRPNR